jgi:hypothetical protein
MIQLGTGKIIKSIISRTLNSNVICSYLHESYNFESNKLILKWIIFDYSSKKRLSLMKVIIFRLFSRNCPNLRFTLVLDKVLANQEKNLKIRTMPFGREFKN